jgi:hypothetical protein
VVLLVPQISCHRAGHYQNAVEFFDGDPAGAFVWGVIANVLHGLPLSLADRRAARGPALEWR